MTRKYEVSHSLSEAIDKIFNLPHYGFETYHGYEALGHSEVNVFGLSGKKPVPEQISLEERVGLLRKDLEEAIVLNALQSDEFEGDDLKRIADESRATLIVLREIHHFFPTIPAASKEEFEEYRKKV